MSDVTRNIVAVGFAPQAECEACLAAPLGLRAIGVDGRLLGVWVSHLDALESWLPLRRRQAAEGIVEETYVALAVLGEPMLTGWSVHGVVNDNMVGAVGWGLAASGKRTSIKRAEQRLPG